MPDRLTSASTRPHCGVRADRVRAALGSPSAHDLYWALDTGGGPRAPTTGKTDSCDQWVWSNHPPFFGKADLRSSTKTNGVAGACGHACRATVRCRDETAACAATSRDCGSGCGGIRREPAVRACGSRPPSPQRKPAEAGGKRGATTSLDRIDESVGLACLWQLLLDASMRRLPSPGAPERHPCPCRSTWDRRDRAFRIHPENR